MCGGERGMTTLPPLLLPLVLLGMEQLAGWESLGWGETDVGE